MKKSLSISDASRATGLSQKQLRSYEARGYISEPFKVRCGEIAYRRYTAQHIAEIKAFKRFVDEGFTLQAASRKIKEKVLRHKIKIKSPISIRITWDINSPFFKPIDPNNFIFYHFHTAFGLNRPLYCKLSRSFEQQGDILSKSLFWPIPGLYLYHQEFHRSNIAPIVPKAFLSDCICCDKGDNTPN